VDRHILKNCPAAIVDCPFKHAGCSIRGPRRGVEQHVDTDSKAHLKIMCSLVGKQKNEIEDLRSQMEAMTRSTDGTLLWRIPNFSTFLQDARLSPNTNAEICSVPFYTNKYGYKLIASVFPNGDGVGAEGKFLSLYVKILPGDYDNLLEWPFTYPIKFTLIDQAIDGEKRQNIEERFDPDPNWKTFQKPLKENTANDCLGYGYPKYVSHEVLLKKRSYLTEDCIFVKIEVDNSGMIKM
jgi:TNF receptor-associated factor 4